MNRFDEALSRTSPSDNAWHCPWFRLIEGFSFNGIIFGGLAYALYSVWFGLVAVGIGLFVSAFSMGSRSRKDASC